MSSQSAKTLLVTGANGFIGGHVIRTALEKGYSVRGAVRTESSAAKLRDVFAEHSSRFSTTIVPDISVVESFAHVFEGDVTGAIHTASPFVFEVEDTVRDLLEPAIKGGVTILAAAQRYSNGKVRRVVNMSSYAAIVDASKGQRPGYTYSEKDWNPMTYEEAATAGSVEAYCASKALAEKAMDDFIAENKPSFAVTHICPPWVFGPHYPELRSTAKLNQSSALLFNLLGAKEVPPFDFAGFADVRDVAAALLAALEKDTPTGDRFLTGSYFDWQSVLDYARETVPEAAERLPLGRPGERQTHEVYAMDGSKAEKVLGIHYTSLRDSIRDSFKELLAAEKAEAHANA